MAAGNVFEVKEGRFGDGFDVGVKKGLSPG